jgi:hypothetical protein
MHVPPRIVNAGDRRLRPGDIRWVAIRNPREQPEHAFGPGKHRPAVLVRPAAPGDRWIVIGVTSQAIFKTTGGPRVRIRPELWEFAYPGLNGPGYVWSPNHVSVATADIAELIGTAPPELRAHIARPIETLDRRTRNDFLRFTPDELDQLRRLDGHEAA